MEWLWKGRCADVMCILSEALGCIMWHQHQSDTRYHGQSTQNLRISMSYAVIPSKASSFSAVRR